MRGASAYLLCKNLRNLKPGSDDIHILFRCSDPACALFLEAMRDEDSLFKPNRGDSAVGTGSIVFNHLQDASSAEALEYLSRMMLAAVLGKM